MLFSSQVFSKLWRCLNLYKFIGLNIFLKILTISYSDRPKNISRRTAISRRIVSPILLLSSLFIIFSCVPYVAGFRQAFNTSKSASFSFLIYSIFSSTFFSATCYNLSAWLALIAACLIWSFLFSISILNKQIFWALVKPRVIRTGVEFVGLQSYKSGVRGGEQDSGGGGGWQKRASDGEWSLDLDSLLKLLIDDGLFFRVLETWTLALNPLRDAIVSSISKKSFLINWIKAKVQVNRSIRLKTHDCNTISL